MADAKTHGPVFLFLEKHCLEQVNFRLKNKEAKLTPHFWCEKAEILQEIYQH
jgi:hypothetical protein